MKNDELRALADAFEPMAKAPRFEDMDVPAFCRWLRACADAQPVAWVDVTDSYEGPYIFHGKELLPAGRHDLYTHPAPAAPHHAMLDSHRRLVEQAIHDTEHPSGMSTHDGKARIDASILRRMLAIIDSLPAAPQAMEDANVWKQIVPDDEPQAEPKLGELMREQRNSRIVAGAYPDGNPNAGAIMAQTSQAETKREPLPGLAPTHRCPACGALWRQCDDASWNLRSALCCGLCDAGRVELVRLLDEPKREPLPDHEIVTMYAECPRSDAEMIDFARSVERAHGIGGSDAE